MLMNDGHIFLIVSGERVIYRSVRAYKTDELAGYVGFHFWKEFFSRHPDVEIFVEYEPEVLGPVISELHFNVRTLDSSRARATARCGTVDL